LSTDHQCETSGARRGGSRFRALLRVPPLSDKQRKMIWLLAVAEFFDSYDASLVTIALLPIQQGLGVPEAEVGRLGFWIRLGMALSLAITLLADRLGRRRLLLATVLGFSLFTFLTAFARDANEFIVLQMLARAFIGAEVLLASVVLVEELSARDRGWGIGVLGALASLGHGAASIVFAGIEYLPYGWRALYVLGALPLVVVAWLRRNLEETERFERQRAERAKHRGWRALLLPVRSLLSMYPGRLFALLAVVFSLDLVHWTVFGFTVKTMQGVHGYAPYQVMILFLTGGALGVMGNIVAGALGDHFGRKRVIFWLMGMYALCAWGFYNSAGIWLPASWIGIVFCATGLGVLWKAIGNELFPTSYRSTAAGVRLLVATLGGAAGFWVESWLYPHAHAALGGGVETDALAHSLAITWMLPALVVPLLGVSFIPETAGRELEEIAPERSGP